MSDTEVPKGQLFSRVYLEKGKPASDGERFRTRIASLASITSFNRADMAKIIALELGVEVPFGGSHPRTTYYFDRFIAHAEVRDVLDVISLIHKNIQSNTRADAQSAYRNYVSKIFREENLGYRLDEDCGVHFYIDEEFERSRVSVVGCLSTDAYNAARDAFEDAHRALLNSDTLTAVRRSFDAVENVFKLHFGVARLGTSEIKTKLTPILQATYAGRVNDAANRLSASFAEWTNAAHQFRHAPGVSDPSPPPMDIAVMMVSASASYLRWLVELAPSA